MLFLLYPKCSVNVLAYHLNFLMMWPIFCLPREAVDMGRAEDSAIWIHILRSEANNFLLLAVSSFMCCFLHRIDIRDRRSKVPNTVLGTEGSIGIVIWGHLAFLQLFFCSILLCLAFSLFFFLGTRYKHSSRPTLKTTPVQKFPLTPVVGSNSCCI